MPVASIRMVMGDTDRTPWDAGTFGSRTTPTMGPQLRAAAATAREALLDLAAARWAVAREKLTAENGAIRRRRGQPDALVRRADARPGSHPGGRGADAPVAPASRWKIAGAEAPKVDGRDFVTGKHRYASDITRTGMSHGKVLRPPSFEASLLSLDAGKAEAIPGVKVVRDADFVGVVAPDPGTAARAVAALDAKWKETAGAAFEREPLRVPQEERGRSPSAASRMSRAPSNRPSLRPTRSSRRPTPFSTSRTRRSSRAPPSPNGTPPMGSSRCGPARSVPSP